MSGVSAQNIISLKNVCFNLLNLFVFWVFFSSEFSLFILDSLRFFNTSSLNGSSIFPVYLERISSFLHDPIVSLYIPAVLSKSGLNLVPGFWS